MSSQIYYYLMVTVWNLTMRRKRRWFLLLHLTGHLRSFEGPPGLDLSVPHPLAPLLSSRIPSSGLIQSILWGDCLEEKDVAEANKRIITTGSKQCCKSIPSGHGGFCMKQRKSKTRQTGRCTEREGRDQRNEEEKGGEERPGSLSHGEGHRQRVLLLDWCLTLIFQLLYVRLSLFSVLITLSHALHQTSVSRLIHNSDQSRCLLYS